MARPGGPTTLLTCARGEWRKHSLDVGGGVSRYKWVYRDRRGRPGVTTQSARGCDMAQQCPATRRRGVATRRRGAATCMAARATQRAPGACVAIQGLYRDREAKAAALRHGVPARVAIRKVTPATRPRYDTLCATTRRPARGLCAAWA